MNHKTLTFLLAFCLPLTAVRADLLAPSRTTIQSVNLQTVSGFSAQFWMTEDEHLFTGLERSSALRQLKQTTQVKRRTPVYMALFFANPGIRVTPILNRRPHTYSDISFDFYVVNPLGELITVQRGLNAWRGNPPPPGLTHLARDRSSITFEAIDAPGEYTVIVVVHDNVRRVDIKLTRRLELLE